MSRVIYDINSENTDRQMVTLNDGEFPLFIEDINTLLHSSGLLRLNLYADPSGNSFVLDITNGNPISAKLISKMEYIFASTDASENIIDGYFLITFDDGSQFSIYNADHHLIWYSFEDLDPANIKQFT